MYFILILVSAISNTSFHSLTKSLPKMDHPFASLTVSFFIGSAMCVLLLLLTKGGQSVSEAFCSLNWISAFIGVLLFGIETSLYYLYRGGSPISSTALVISVVQTIFNLLLASLLLREDLKPVNIIGIVMCLAGTFLVVQKRDKSHSENK